jgi:hypothetical protein
MSRVGVDAEKKVRPFAGGTTFVWRTEQESWMMQSENKKLN